MMDYNRTCPMEKTLQSAIIHVVDDDAPLCAAMARLFRSADIAACFYHSVQDFLSHPWLDHHGCLVIDVRLPGTNGLEFQAQLSDLGILIPAILMTGYGDIPMSVRAMKAGAVDFLSKPFNDQEMLDAIETALQRDLRRRAADELNGALQLRFNGLSNREKQVLQHVVSGRLNKQVAGDLGISEITVKIHRAAVMRKMQAGSFAELVRMAEAIER